MRRPIFAHRSTSGIYPSVSIAAALVAVTASVNSIAAEPFTPFRARVVAPSAAVLSGPGEGFYPTDALAEGDAIDVFRQDANGWCAIRPPEGSFSWVFGRHVRLIKSADHDVSSKSVHLCKIDKPDVASRIGSRHSQRRNSVQIRLKQGEVVRILGEETIDGETWYKVAPPAGEFRWIHVRNIRRTGPIPLGDADAAPDDERATVQPASSTTESSDTSADSNAVEPAIAKSAIDEAAVAAESSDAWRTTPNPDRLATPLGLGEAQRVDEARPAAESAHDVAPSENSQQRRPADGPQTAPSSPPERETSEISRSLAELELRLSRMVTEPPVAWNAAPLHAQALTLLAGAATAAERSAVQATLDRIERFAAIERRYRAVGGPVNQYWAGSFAGQPPVGPPAERVAGMQSQPVVGPATAPTAAAPYDAVGILRPVVSRRPGAPPFALVDERGLVVSFVTPSPGVNLQPLLGRRIGVAGNRGYISELQQPHVMAGRAAPLDARLIR